MEIMPDPELTPDCSRCEALCCVLLPFDKGPAFAFDKPGGVACRHLGSGHRCTIHGQLAERGFAGCVAFSCHGAGQRVTKLLIAGRPWRGDAERMQQVEDGFRHLRQVHEALSLLRAAGSLPLPPEVEADRLVLINRLDAGRDWAPDSLSAAVGRDGVFEEVRAFLATLRGVLR